VQILAEIALP